MPPSGDSHHTRRSRLLYPLSGCVRLLGCLWLASVRFGGLRAWLLGSLYLLSSVPLIDVLIVLVAIVFLGDVRLSAALALIFRNLWATAAGEPVVGRLKIDLGPASLLLLTRGVLFLLHLLLLFVRSPATPLGGLVC